MSPLENIIQACQACNRIRRDPKVSTVDAVTALTDAVRHIEKVATEALKEEKKSNG